MVFDCNEKRKRKKGFKLKQDENEFKWINGLIDYNTR